MNFRNVKGTFEIFNEDEFVEECIWDEDEDDIYYEMHRYESYIDSESGNVIIFDEIRMEGESHLDEVADIANCISEEAYNYICNVLNTYRNTTIYWYQIEGTTSDYYVIPNNIMLDYKALTNFIYNSKKNGSYKYMIYRDGEFHYIKEV